jgi:hypothetical protein
VITDGSLDLALVSAPDRFPAGIEMQRLSEEPMVFVCRPDLHLEHRRHVAISELAGEDLIGFPAEFGLRRLVDGAFTAAGVTAHTPYEVALEYSVAAGLVRHGLGTIFMPVSEAGCFPFCERWTCDRPWCGRSTLHRLNQHGLPRRAPGLPNCCSRWLTRHRLSEPSLHGEICPRSAGSADQPAGARLSLSVSGGWFMDQQSLAEYWYRAV